MLLAFLTIARQPARLTANRLRRRERTFGAKRLRKRSFRLKHLKILSDYCLFTISSLLNPTQGVIKLRGSAPINTVKHIRILFEIFFYTSIPFFACFFHRKIGL